MPSNSKESRIPVGTGFSPNLVSLPDYVHAIVEHSGDEEAIEEAVNSSPVWIGDKTRTTRRTRRHPMEAGVQYGLLTEGDYEATNLAKRLDQLNEDELYKEFARHILLNLGGLRVIGAVQEMDMEGRNITGDSLARYLTDQGFRVTEHNTAINTLRMWLSKAGLVPESGRSKDAWLPDLEVKEDLVGIDDDSISAIAGLTNEQIAFVKTLCRLEPDDWIAAANVRDLAEGALGVRFGRASLPNEVLRPLEDLGLIEFESGGTQSGKTSQLKLTSRFRSEVLEPFLERALPDLNRALTAYFRERPEDIYSALESNDKYVKGKALEAYTVYVMRLLGLRFLGWRRRAQETGFSEVDVLMGGTVGSLPNTWQVQCKNTPSSPIRLEDVAKEVGLLPLTHATHVLIIGNTSFTGDARAFAREVMLKSSVTIFLLDQDDFESIRRTPANIARILRQQGERIRDLRIRAPLWSGIDRPDDDEQSRLEFPLG
jgi:site-specific DNA-methyltransferase (cytosine-N4-specific)